VRTRTAAVAPGAWIQGETLIATDLAEQRFPDRWELDTVAPSNPVVLRSMGEHVISANSLALAAAGVDRTTVPPDGGRIERDANGEPNGILHEQAKMRLDPGREGTVVPTPGPAERVAALEKGLRYLNTLGIACVHDQAREADDIGDYHLLREADTLTCRVRFYVRGIEARTTLEHLLELGLHSEFGDSWLRLGGVKFSIDGSETGHNAALCHDYPGEPGNRGLIRIEPEILVPAVEAAHRAGLQVAVHAIGPRAVDIALDAFDNAQRQAPNPRLKHRIEHAFLPLHDGQLERMAELGVIWSTQPAFLAHSGELWQEIFGTEAAERSVALRSGTDLGLTIQLNSDFPCTPANPFASVHAAVTRTTQRGTVLGTAEAITVDEAMRFLTNTSDYSMSRDRRQGAITPGYLADVMVTDQDPYVVDPQDLLSVGVDMTVVDGEPVHRRA
jgi:hypothetical protein